MANNSRSTHYYDISVQRCHYQRRNARNIFLNIDLLNIPILRLSSVSRNIKVDRRFDLRVAFTRLHNVFTAKQQQSMRMAEKEAVRKSAGPRL
eukprot:scaffold118740_cov20-Prasinocladus_malaysianus.AAC.1